MQHQSLYAGYITAFLAMLNTQCAAHLYNLCLMCSCACRASTGDATQRHCPTGCVCVTPAVTGWTAAWPEQAGRRTQPSSDASSAAAPCARHLARAPSHRRQTRTQLQPPRKPDAAAQARVPHRAGARARRRGGAAAEPTRCFAVPHPADRGRRARPWRPGSGRGCNVAHAVGRRRSAQPPRRAGRGLAGQRRSGGRSCGRARTAGRGHGT